MRASIIYLIAILAGLVRMLSTCNKLMAQLAGFGPADPVFGGKKQIQA